MSRKDELVDYLSEMLALDPLTQAGVILERRRRFRDRASPENAAHGPGSASGEDGESPGSLQRRGEARSALNAIRDELWDLSPEQALARIDALDLEPYPDLRSAGIRLRRVAEHLPDFRKMVQHPLVDVGFADAFRSVLSAGPAMAAATRRSAMSDLSAVSVRDASRKSANVVGEEFPDLYFLEATWLDRIANLPVGDPAEAALNKAPEGASSRMPSPWLWLCGVALLLKACDVLLEGRS